MTDNILAPKANIQSGAKIQPIVPSNIDEAFRMAQSIYVSGMYPDSYASDAQGNTGKNMTGPADQKTTVSRIMIGIQKSMEVGLPPITGLSTIYIVNNRPTLFGDGIPALLYASGKIAYIKEWTEGAIEQGDFVAYCEIKRKDSDVPIVGMFSQNDAKKARLMGKTGPWTDYPKRQMQMRARGFAARDGAADILSGLGVYEEVRDMDDDKKPSVVDTSSLDDLPAPAPLLAAPQPDLNAIPQNTTAEKVLAVETTQTPAICAACHGKGTTPFSEVDPTTGEAVEGIQPCQSCQKV